jgi:hypothetical protein
MTTKVCSDARLAGSRTVLREVHLQELGTLHGHAAVHQHQWGGRGGWRPSHNRPYTEAYHADAIYTVQAGASPPCMRACVRRLTCETTCSLAADRTSNAFTTALQNTHANTRVITQPIPGVKGWGGVSPVLTQGSWPLR